MRSLALFAGIRAEDRPFSNANHRGSWVDTPTALLFKHDFSQLTVYCCQRTRLRYLVILCTVSPHRYVRYHQYHHICRLWRTFNREPRIHACKYERGTDASLIHVTWLLTSLGMHQRVLEALVALPASAPCRCIFAHQDTTRAPAYGIICTVAGADADYYSWY